MPKNDKRGVSLIELIIYIGVLAVVMILVSGSFLSVIGAMGQAESRVEVNSNLRFIAEKIAQDLRSVTSSFAVIVPATTSTPSSTLTFVVGTSTITYATSTFNQMQRSVNSAAQVISSDVVDIDAVMFKRIENTNSVLNKTFVSIEITITSSYKSQSPNWRYSQNLKTTVSIR